MRKKGEPRYDTTWRKSRIAVRILLREEVGKLTKRDVELGPVVVSEGLWLAVDSHNASTVARAQVTA